MRRKGILLAVFVCPAVAPFVMLIAGARGPTQEQRAREILEATGVKGGLIVHVGCGDGRLTAALCAGGGYLVHGLDAEAANVQEARRHIRSLGLYGRVTAERLTGEQLPYVDNLVNLIVSERPMVVGADEVLRVLAPNGVAYVQDGDEWVKTVKPRPMEIDEWTHYLHDATGNAVGHDSVVGPPRRFQWVGSPRWSRHHDRMASTSACVSAGGRIFYIIDEGSRASIQLPSSWTLVARDAFNGTILWKRPIAAWMTQLWPFKSGPAQLPRRLVADGDRVYVTLGLDGAALSMLDAGTGEIIRTYEGTQMTEELVFSEGVLFGMVKENPPATRWNEYMPKHRSVGSAKTRVASEWPWDRADRRIMAIEAESGNVLWQKEYPVAPLTLGADANGVFFHDAEKIVCLDRRSGEQVWGSSPVAVTTPMAANFGPTLVIYEGVVLFAGGNPSRILTALSAETGRTLWTSNYDPSGHNSPHDLLVIGGLAWAGATAGRSHSGVFRGWDPYTGEVKKQFPPDVDIDWFHHRCYRSKATERYILPSRAGVEFIDFAAEHWTTQHWVRGGCLYGVMPCNGLLYTPPHDCACFFEAKLSGFCALAAAHTGREHPQAVPDEERLERGPAYWRARSEQAGEADWPTYRHDAARSGYSRSIVPAELKPAWERQLEGGLTSIVVANGSVYVAAADSHTLYALNEEDGEIGWSYTAGGRIDSPPTIYKGLALFGCADGRVYCLDASDGEVVWRFQAAAQDLRMTAFEQVESVWPVHGSVLVQDDRVYCVAGRSMFVDGGLRFLQLDPATGAKISERVLNDCDPDTGENLQVHVKNLNMPVALPDILSSDGRYVFMRSQRFSLEGVREQTAPHSGNHSEQAREQYGEGMHLFCPTGFLDNAYMHRTYWVFGRSWASGAGGYYMAGRFAPAGRVMVFDDSRVYGFGRLPDYYKWSTPLEYRLFAAETFPESRSIEYHWTNNSIPILVQAMVLADRMLFVAGPPDVVDEEEAFDYWSADPNDPNVDRTIPAQLSEQDAALRGQRGALLWAVSIADGKDVARYNLESLPVWDGMAAANGRLYLSMANGKVRCYVGTNYPPQVDVGEAQSVYPRAAAVLDAKVADDGLPRVDPCDPSSEPIGVTVKWTKHEGPGEVSFADPCAAGTAAAFSEWGKYVLRLTAFDGSASYYDDAEVFVFRPGDLDRDNDVDVFDVDLLAAEWLSGECGLLNDWCGGADQTAGGGVDFNDYAVTSSHWLSGVRPAAPARVTATGSDVGISLDWADNGEADLAGYNVYRSLSPGRDYYKLTRSPATDSEYVDAGVTNCVAYHYVVTAIDEFGYESGYSEGVLASAGVQPVMRLLAGIGVQTVGSGVSNWQDQVGSNHAKQGTPADRPAVTGPAIHGRPAIDFSGDSKHLDVADSKDINTGGPYSGKTLVAVFKTAGDIAARQVIWEQGGGVRGLNLYIDGGNLYVNGWNLGEAEVQWGPTGLSRPVSAETPYVATLVLDAGEGTFEAFVNGAHVGLAGGVSKLYGHSNDCAFGHVEGATRFHDGSTAGPADFGGEIAEFHQYNKVLSSIDRQNIETALMLKYGMKRRR